MHALVRCNVFPAKQKKKQQKLEIKFSSEINDVYGWTFKIREPSQG